MKKSMNRLLKTALCILLSVSLSSCWNSRELDTLAIVMGVGFDRPEDSGNVQITLQIIKPSEIGSPQKYGAGGGGSKGYWNASNTGNTAFATIRDMTNQSSRKLFFTHNQVLIFGRRLAEEGVRSHVDLFARDPETRGDVWVLVAQDKAGEILDAKSELQKIPARKVAEMVEGQAAATSQSSAVRFREFVARLMSSTTAPVATMIELSGEGEEKMAQICGTAVFQRDKLVGTLDKTESRGLLWVLGEVQSGILEVEGSGGSLICLETIRASSKVKAELRQDKVIMKITITEEGNVGEQTGTENLTDLAQIAILEERKKEAIRTEIMAAVERAKELGADVFGFGEVVHRKYPDQWRDMESRWDEIFQEIEVDVTVNAKLRLLGRIDRPILTD